jgi:hypothetical protein
MFSESTLLHLLGLLVAGPLVAMAWRSAERLGPASIIIRSLLLYICGAHLLKGMLLALVDWQPAVDAGFVPRMLTQVEAALTAQLILVNSVCVIAASLSATYLFRQAPSIGINSAAPTGTPKEILHTILVCLIIILPYKFFINHIMRWGVPALTPTNTIPLVTGISVYLVRDALLCLCATALYQCFVSIKQPSIKLRSITLLAALSFVAIDLAMGSKFAMLGMIFAAISLATRAFLQQDAKARIRTLLISMGVLIVFLPTYQAANILRFIKLDNGLDIIDIILKTSDKVDLDIVNVIFSILGRATGAEGVATAVVLDGRLNIGIMDIFFASDFSSQYTYALSGNPDDNVAFGATLAGTYSLLCRADMTCISSITYFTTLILLATLIFLVVKTPFQPSVKYGVATSLALVAVHAQLASGGLLLFGQRVFVIVTAGWLIEFLIRWQRYAPPQSASHAGPEQNLLHR